MQRFIIVPFFFFISLFSAAQTYFTDGVSGLSISAHAGEGYWDSHTGMELYYTFGGRIDAGVRYYRTGYNVSHIEATGVHFSGKPRQNVIELEAIYWMLRSEPMNKMRINVGAWGNYGWGKYAGTTYTLNAGRYENLSEDALSMGSILSTEIGLTAKWSIQPYAWTGKAWGVSKFTEASNPREDNFSGIMAALGFRLERNYANGNRFWVGNEFYTDSFNEGNATSLSILVGYNFSITSNNLKKL